MRYGIDLGGTKTELIALDRDGREVWRERRPTPAKSYEAILDNIHSMVSLADEKLRARGSIGIGIPGTESPRTRLIKNANTTCLIGQPFGADLERKLGRQVRLANDANCFALSEASDGAGTGASVVFGVIIGTGTGGGVVVNGSVLVGPNSIAGEWGHNPLPWPQPEELPGPACYCGKNGCIETYLSGPGLAHAFRSASGRDLLPREIDEAAIKGDSTAERVLRAYEDRAARALASVINILDPNVIVLGGGVSNLERLYRNIPLLWGKYVFSDEVETRLVRARHGDSSGVRGAAWLNQ